jgi:putative flippase GtrA
MSDIDNVLIGIHAIAGILWIIFGIVLVVLLNRISKKKEFTGENNGIRNTVIRIRATGGITIILGIILFAILSSEGKIPAFNSIKGILLILGVILALIVYVVINEGYTFRKIEKLNSENMAKILNMATLASVLTVLVLILMVIGSS